MTVSSTGLERARTSLTRLLAQLEIEGAEDLVKALCIPLAQALAERAARSHGCVIVGLSGAQGTGKSTVAQLVCVLLKEGFGLNAILLSLDDYYLTRAARKALARDRHPLLETRGVPGTHDVDALHTALKALRVASTGDTLELPQFSKADDDRLPDPRRVAGPFDVVVFEGWCVGAPSQVNSALVEPINALERESDGDASFRTFVNAQLAQRYAQLWNELDMLVYLAAPSFETVRAFRTEQEQKLHRSAQAGARGLMSDAQVQHFTEYFERVTRHMLQDMPGRADLVVRLDANRRVLACDPRH
jgi:D-glycerate 3-kinase